ncbi:hypothetical protein DF046_28975 [Burkholderia cepacia]|uniref:hypothetical protein n=1 Tax=Burkholderia TaxID=32008 RepID=UPI000754D39D|nr:MULTISPECIES: hypothetical protein [Burkholderia]KVF19859.1 hypothetical protein WJ06_17090 [Burkholderia cepacia]MCA7902586.1 hypothetical protein [Burkholderia cepacia]MCA8215718.1 hypothetical protein [Burkholderia cepacia]RQT46613.1 hypothetical protein DF046_28975 [Burkholderia cepacia]THJ54288.1 hypothetical protein E9536_12070 [Burkholderia sp. LS-044]
MMTDTERDTLYTDLCRTMTRIGEADASLFLARFALLSIEAIGDTATVARLIADASDGLPSAGMLASTLGR